MTGRKPDSPTLSEMTVMLKKKHRCALMLPVLLVSLVLPLSTQERVVFEGRPIKAVEMTFAAVYERELNADESFQYQIRIVERAGRYFWASRQMKEVVRSESGAYVTYHAMDGSGYVRTGNAGLLDLRDMLSEEMRQTEIGYVEHLLQQFTSITYFGNRAGSPSIR